MTIVDHPQLSAPLFTLISKSRSTGCLQMGHLSVWNLRTLAQSLHIHCTKNKQKYRKNIRLSASSGLFMIKLTNSNTTEEYQDRLLIIIVISIKVQYLYSLRREKLGHGGSSNGWGYKTHPHLFYLRF